MFAWLASMLNDFARPKSEILGVHVRIKQDVAGLEIAVDDLQP